MHPPNDWAEVYAAVMEMRKNGAAQNAAVDTMGCERLGSDSVTPKVKSTFMDSRLVICIAPDPFMGLKS